MKRAGLLLAAGIGTYLLILLVNFPAGRITDRLQEQYAPLIFHSVSGSVFSGQAARVERNALVAGPVEWRFQPSGLLKGRLEYRLHGSVMQNPFEGRVAVDMAGRIHLQDVETVLNPADLVKAYAPFDMTTTGRMTLHVETLELQDGFPADLNGKLLWSDAGVSAPVSLVLGEVEVLLGSDAQRVTGEVSNAGDTRVSGSLGLSASGDYDVDLRITPGRAASPEVVEFLGTWGQPGPGGSYRLADSGRF